MNQYRLLFILAGTYNLVYALWLFISPQTLFRLIRISVPFVEELILPLSIGIVAFVPIYIFATLRPEKAKPWIAFCLLAKMGPPLLMFVLIPFFHWPLEILIMIFFNDVIWWYPFVRFLMNTEIIMTMDREQ